VCFLSLLCPGVDPEMTALRPEKPCTRGGEGPGGLDEDPDTAISISPTMLFGGPTHAPNSAEEALAVEDVGQYGQHRERLGTGDPLHRGGAKQPVSASGELLLPPNDSAMASSSTEAVLAAAVSKPLPDADTAADARTPKAGSTDTPDARTFVATRDLDSAHQVCVRGCGFKYGCQSGCGSVGRCVRGGGLGVGAIRLKFC